MLNILQHDFLAALLLNDLLVVGQVERRGLNAVVPVAGAEDFVDDADRR